MDFLPLLLISLFCPILPLVLCGLLVFLFEKLFLKMTGGFGRGLLFATAMIGTPVHELSHAIMCLPFGHKITKLCLWSPKAPDGVFGYVEHSYRKSNLWHVFGNMFIGVAPIIGGLGIITLIMRICFPETLFTYYSSALSTSALSDIPSMLLGCIKMIPSMITESSVPLYGKIIGGVLMLSVCMHISLSPEDVKGGLGSLLIYSVICILLTVIFYLIGGSVAVGYAAALISWVFFVLSLYMVVFACIFVLLALGLVVFLIGKLFGK